MSKTEVMALLPIKSPVSLWSWVKQGRFPAPRQIGPEGSRRSTIGWLDREVYEALANLPKRLPKGSKVQP
jgi:predicted DNA-binding transcriptional regulator AlpA